MVKISNTDRAIGIILLLLLLFLIYFGVFNIAKFMPETCIASTGFECANKPHMDSNSISISISNKLGHDIEFTQKNTAITFPKNSSYPNECYDNIFFCKENVNECNNTVFKLKDDKDMKIRINCQIPTSVAIIKMTANYTDSQTGQIRSMNVHAMAKITNNITARDNIIRSLPRIATIIASICLIMCLLFKIFKKSNTEEMSLLAIVSTAIGLIATTVFGIILSIVATILGIIALIQINRTPNLKGIMTAIMGIILGLIVLIAWILVSVG